MMFSLKEKQYIAQAIERILLKLNHPEMRKEIPVFKLSVKGKEGWSWAEIDPNWTFGIDNPPGANPFNEIVRDILKDDK